MATINVVVETSYCCSNSTYVSYIIKLLTNDEDKPLYDDDSEGNGVLIEYDKTGQLFGYDANDNFVIYAKPINHSNMMVKTYTLFAKLKYMMANNAIFTTNDMDELKDLIHSYEIVEHGLPANYRFVYEYC